MLARRARREGHVGRQYILVVVTLYMNAVAAVGSRDWRAAQRLLVVANGGMIDLRGKPEGLKKCEDMGKRNKSIYHIVCESVIQ